MKHFNVATGTDLPPDLRAVLHRRPQFDPTLAATVAATLNEVRLRGEVAALESAQRFDAPGLTVVKVTEDEFAKAQVDSATDAALEFAASRIRDFHDVQLGVVTRDWEELPRGWGWRTDATTHPHTGFEGQRMLPLRHVGVYVPGGKASYPSSVLMNVIPAQVAGVDRVTVTTPARNDGTLSPEVLAARRMLGVKDVYKVGGAAAIGLLAYHLEVDKIVGPGNAYVNEAKRQVWGVTGLDGYAGPSEVAVIFDSSVDPAWVAADFLSQLEHAPDNAGLLVTQDEAAFEKVLDEIQVQVLAAPRREVLEASLANHAVAAVIAHRETLLEAVNLFAPEHLSILCKDAGAWAADVENCGCVLIGPYTPQSAGDYCSGPSHTLPTSGSARFGSPVSVVDFLKIQSVSMHDEEDLRQLLPAIDTLATAEGFPAHARGATIRFEDQENKS